MSDRISTSLSYALTLRALQDNQAKLFEIQNKISTGKRINSPKDDPIGISRLLSLQQQQTDTEQYQQNIDTMMSELSLEEVQLQEVTDRITMAKSLILQGNAGVRSATDQNAIAIQLEHIRDELLAIANNSTDSGYKFSGAKTHSKSVVQDPTGAYVYNGDELQRDIQIGSAISLPVNDTAESIFFNLATNDTTVTSYSGSALVTIANSGLVDVGTLGVITPNSLKINGIDIAPTSSDEVSAVDATASAIAIAKAINSTSQLHGVVAKAESNVFTFTGGTYTTDPLVAGDLTINGVPIIGTPATADAQGLAELINTVIAGAPACGVEALVVANEVQLIAEDGRNIGLSTTGNTASMNFTNFASNGGLALNQVIKAAVSLQDHQAITIEGSITGVGAGQLGINAGEYAITPNTGNAILASAAIVKARPEGCSNNDKYFIKFLTPTTFNVFKESDPDTPLTQFQQFSVTQTAKDATKVQNVPATYNNGDTIIVEGVQIKITETPAANDSFTVAVKQVANQNVFSSIDNAIEALRNHSNEPERLSYLLGLAVVNLTSAEEQVINVTSRVGARMELAETQKQSNEDFIFFTKQCAATIEDENLASAISEFMKYQTMYEATQQIAIRTQKLSLFNYL